MGMLPRPQLAEEPRLASGKSIGILYAALVVVMSVAQLFTFDGFIGLIFDMNLSVGLVASSLLAPLIVTLGVMALPFLLRMTISPAFRWFSMVCGWFLPAIWLCISLNLVLVATAAPTVGFFGTLGDMAPGWWAVGFSAMLAVLATWASVGLWPARQREK